MSRTLLAAAVSLLVAAPGTALAAKCTFSKGDSPVAKACAKGGDGGIAAAKTEMKKMVAAAKKAGKKFDCDSCHKNDSDYELTKDGKDKFKELLAAAK